MSLRDAECHPANDDALVEPESPPSGVDADELELPDPASQLGFSISSERDANWLVRAVTELRVYRRRVEAWAAGELRKAERRERYLTERYGAQLQRWLEQRLMEEGGRRRSVCLPAGVVGVRARRPKVVVTDPQTALAWAKSEMPGLLQVEISVSGNEAKRLLAWQEAERVDAHVMETISKAGLNSYIAESGEVPGGVELQPSVDELFIR
ncbi:MAG: hypothetical protein WBD40_04950 [Tepidisphaeraceae bacterium]